MPIRSAHRERIASLYKHLETMEPCEDRLKISLTLCKAEGLLKESVMEKNEQERQRLSKPPLMTGNPATYGS